MEEAASGRGGSPPEEQSSPRADHQPHHTSPNFGSGLPNAWRQQPDKWSRFIFQVSDNIVAAGRTDPRPNGRSRRRRSSARCSRRSISRGDAEHPESSTRSKSEGWSGAVAPAAAFPTFPFFRHPSAKGESDKYARLLVAHAGLKRFSTAFTAKAVSVRRVRGRAKEPHQHLRRVLRF